MRTTRILTIVGSVAVVLLVAAALFGTAASAQTPGTQTDPRPVRLEGKVSAVGADSLVLTTRKGDITASC